MPASLKLSWALVFSLALIAALPMLVATVPGAADYPDHLARLHVLSRIGDGSTLDRYFTVHWRWIGNLGVDLPALLLTPALGVERATRLASASIAPLTVIGILMLSRSVHGRVTGSAMLALPLAFAQPFLFGFLNYCLSIGLALIVAALWNADRRRDLPRTIEFGVAALIVWTAHIMGWAVLLILIAGSELASIRGWRDLFLRMVRCLPLFAPAILMAIGRTDAGGALYWYDPYFLTSKLMNFVTVLKGLWMPFDLAMTAAIGVGALLALCWAGGRRMEPRLATGAAMLLLATLILPTTVMGSWGADLRLAPVAIMVAVMAIGPATQQRRERLVLALGLGLFILRAGTIAREWRKAGRTLDARLALLDEVPIGSRLGFLAVSSACRADWALTPDRKLGAYAVVRRDGFTNTLFQIPGSDLMIFRSPVDSARWFDGSQDVPADCPGGTADLATLQMRLEEMRGSGFNGIWIAGLPPRAVPVLHGYAVRYTRENDTLLLKQDRGAQGQRSLP